MDAALDYAPIDGDRHRHGATVHSHPHAGPHTHEERAHGHGGHHHAHEHGHGHSHGLIDESIKRSREGLRAVAISLAVLGLGALAQLSIYLASGSVALLADLIHNFGDASTAIPLGDRLRASLRAGRADRRAVCRRGDLRLGLRRRGRGRLAAHPPRRPRLTSWRWRSPV